MRSCLVVCYSRSGLTARLGREIAASCGADFELIREARGRAGPLGFLRSVWESVRRQQPAILAAENRPADYALVILGAPVWAGQVASPMRSYILQHCQDFNRVALFCTMGGRGGDSALAEMAALCGKPPMAQVAVTDAEIARDTYHGRLVPLFRQFASPGQA